jgi:hypothetical protein
VATIRELLVVPHTHHDVGYTHIPRFCLEAHAASVERAIELCEAARMDTSPTAFRWTFELSRPVLQYLRRASARDVERLRALIAEQRVAVTAGYLHMTQLLGHEEAIHALAPVRELRERFGVSPSIVQHGDINGLPWGTVPLMASADLDVLVMALNPDHGRAPFEQPSAFTWEGPDGSRVLVWLSVHYGFARLASGAVDAALTELPPLLARMAERTDYPFDFLVLHAAMDNMWPDPRVTSAAQAWNAAGHLPAMRVVTIETAMDRARQQAAGADLPVVRGEWVDWWAHGHGSSAFEVGLGRQAQADLRLAETSHALAAMARLGAPATPPRQATEGRPPVSHWGNPPVTPARLASWPERVGDAYDELLLWEEHTWGSNESIQRPASQFTQSHWNEKAAFGYRAHADARELRRDAMDAVIGALPAGPDPALVVVNPVSRPRDAVVTIDTADGHATQVVRGLPPLGVKAVAPCQPAPTMKPLPAHARTVLENAFYRLEIDPASASIVSLVDTAQQREWVDGNALTGLAGLVYEEADPNDPHPAVATHRRHFHPDTPGPRFTRTAAAGTGAAPTLVRTADSTTLTYDSAAPTLPAIRTSVTVYDALDWIDLSVTLHKVDNLRMEGVHLLFPFALPSPTFWLQSTNAVFRPEGDQLSDTCRDWYSTQHGVGISDGAASVLWATREAPLVQLGGFHTGDWSTAFCPDMGHLHSWLMNNLYFTNFKASQQGEMAFAYRFRTVPGAVAPANVWAWGEAFAAPTVGVVAPVRQDTYQWLDIAPVTVTAQVATPISAADLMTLRLRETAGQAVEARITWAGDGTVALVPIDVLGIPTGRAVEGDGTTFRLRLQPFELVSVAVRRREKGGADSQARE